MKIEIELKTLGEYLKFLRRQKDLSIPEVSKQTKLSVFAIFNAERPDNNAAKFSTIGILLSFYGVSLKSVEGYVRKYYKSKKEIIILKEKINNKRERKEIFAHIVSKNLGEYLKCVRRNLGLTAIEVSRLIGVSIRKIYYIESNYDSSFYITVLLFFCYEIELDDIKKFLVPFRQKEIVIKIKSGPKEPMTVPTKIEKEICDKWEYSIYHSSPKENQ